MPQPEPQLPTNILSGLSQTQEGPDDKILALQGELQTTQDALDEANSKLTEIRAQIEILQDNAKIKSSAVFYAKVFMVLVPTICVVLLGLSAISSVYVTIEGTPVNLALDIGGYAQAALVVAPMVFVATILVQLLKAVFRQPSSEGESSLSDMMKALNRSE